MLQCNSKRFCLIINDAFSMVHFRSGLIKLLVQNGHTVTAVVPFAGKFRASLERLGAEVIEIPMQRFIAPLYDFALFIRLFRLFGTRHFDIVHAMTLKPILYAVPIAKILRTPTVVGLISGSGYLFSALGRTEHPILARAVIAALRLSLLAAKKIWFQNPNDCETFINKKLISRNKSVVIRGSGIDIKEFNPDLCTPELKARKRSELGLPIDCSLVLMVTARRIAAKGIREFAKAAAKVLPERPDWRFLMIAPDDPGTPDHVDSNEAIFKVNGFIMLNGFRDDIRDIVAASDIVTLPSYYQEGLPRFLLEGMACGKPIVTTDHTGCKETVTPDKNGFMVAPRDIDALADALKSLMDNKQLRIAFGKSSRSLCEREFSESIVCNRVLKEIYEL